MGKKAIITFMALILIISLYLNYHYYSAVNYDIPFNDKGNVRIADSLLFERDSIYVDDADPYGVYCIKEGIVPNTKVAIALSEIILSQIYGKDNIIRQRPYDISLINNQVWAISGKRNYNEEGGVFYIAINKRDGRILCVRHEK